MNKWKIYNPKTLQEVEFEINPAEGGAPDRSKAISFQTRSGPGAGVIVFEGQEEVRRYSITGTILWEYQVEFFTDLFDLRHQVKLTDDLGREFWIYVTRFSLERLRKANHPWAHRYTLEYLELEA